MSRSSNWATALMKSAASRRTFGLPSVASEFPRIAPKRFTFSMSVVRQVSSSARPTASALKLVYQSQTSQETSEGSGRSS